MLADYINAIFEFGGALVCAKSIVRLYRDKHVAGYNVSQSVFFTSWGAWNLTYYPLLHQYASFTGGVALMTANGIWSAMAFYYGGGICALKTTAIRWSRKVLHFPSWCVSKSIGRPVSAGPRS